MKRDLLSSREEEVTAKKKPTKMTAWNTFIARRRTFAASSVSKTPVTAVCFVSQLFFSSFLILFYVIILIIAPTTSASVLGDPAINTILPFGKSPPPPVFQDSSTCQACALYVNAMQRAVANCSSFSGGDQRKIDPQTGGIICPPDLMLDTVRDYIDNCFHDEIHSLSPCTRLACVAFSCLEPTPPLTDPTTDQHVSLETYILHTNSSSLVPTSEAMHVCKAMGICSNISGNPEHGVTWKTSECSSFCHTGAGYNFTQCAAVKTSSETSPFSFITDVVRGPKMTASTKGAEETHRRRAAAAGVAMVRQEEQGEGWQQISTRRHGRGRDSGDRSSGRSRNPSLCHVLQDTECKIEKCGGHGNCHGERCECEKGYEGTYCGQASGAGESTSSPALWLFVLVVGICIGAAIIASLQSFVCLYSTGRLIRREKASTRETLTSGRGKLTEMGSDSFDIERLHWRDGQGQGGGRGRGDEWELGKGKGEEGYRQEMRHLDYQVQGFSGSRGKERGDSDGEGLASAFRDMVLRRDVRPRTRARGTGGVTDGDWFSRLDPSRRMLPGQGNSRAEEELKKDQTCDLSHPYYTMRDGEYIEEYTIK